MENQEQQTWYLMRDYPEHAQNPHTDTATKLNRFLMKHRPRLIRSGSYLPGVGRRESEICEPLFTQTVREILRDEAITALDSEAAA